MRRLFWMATGAAGALYGRRKVVRAAQRYVPRSVMDRASQRTQEAAREATSRLRSIRDEARAAMRSTEEDLYREVGPPGGVQQGPDRAAERGGQAPPEGRP